MRGGTHANGGIICFNSSQFYCCNKDSKEHQSFLLSFFVAFSPSPFTKHSHDGYLPSLSLSESFSLYVAGRSLAHVSKEQEKITATEIRLCFFMVCCCKDWPVGAG
jgi:hypothetical protein